MPFTFAISTVTLLLAQAGPAVHAQGGASRFGPHAEVAGEMEFSGELIVRPKQTLGARERARALAALGAAPKRHNPKTDEFVVTVGVGPVKPGAAENAFADRLMKTGLFEYACPNWTIYPLATPNDPRYPEQWHHAMMQSPLAWDLHRADGASEVIIAVTDTGIVVHEDLLNRVPGFNSADDLAEADGGDMTDINGHGTHVAGCAAAAGNNAVGVSGMGWNLRIMPIRVSTAANGGASYENLLQGIQWAAENGAKVISTSYSGIGYPPIETTGEYVRSLDATMMWAAGNSATNHAGWDFEHVVVVGASNQSDQRAGFSSYGLGVDLFAPGVSILSSTRDGGYGFASGTSMATPVANGALALVRSANPDLSAEHAEYLLFNSCDFWGGSANDEQLGWGRINLRRALEFALAADSPQPPVARDDMASALVGASVELDVLANDFDANMDALEIQSFSATTSAGRAVSLVEGTKGARDRLVVADVGPAAGTQSLTYTLVEPLSGATATATASIDTSIRGRLLRARQPDRASRLLPARQLRGQSRRRPQLSVDQRCLRRQRSRRQCRCGLHGLDRDSNHGPLDADYHERRRLEALDRQRSRREQRRPARHGHGLGHAGARGGQARAARRVLRGGRWRGPVHVVGGSGAVERGRAGISTLPRRRDRAGRPQPRRHGEQPGSRDPAQLVGHRGLCSRPQRRRYRGRA